MDLPLSKRPSLAVVRRLFEPGARVAWATSFDECVDLHQQGVVGVVLDTGCSDFPWSLGFFGLPGGEPWLLASARSLSVWLDCRTIYTGFPDDNARPFDCILFESGLAYLADDSGTKLFGEGELKVRRVRRLPRYDLAAEDFVADDLRTEGFIADEPEGDGS